MSAIRRFEDIVAWQKSRVLVREVYLLTMAQPFCRDFVLRDQMHRAAISISSNIAEGFERYRPAEFRQFLSVAKASCAELRSQIYLAFDVGYISEQTLVSTLRQAEEVGRLIGGFRSSIS